MGRFFFVSDLEISKLLKVTESSVTAFFSWSCSLVSSDIVVNFLHSIIFTASCLLKFILNKDNDGEIVLFFVMLPCFSAFFCCRDS